MRTKVHHNLQPMHTGLRVALWSLETSDPWEQVAQPGYLTERYAAYGLRAGHRVMVSASILEPLGEYKWLLVTDANDKSVTSKEVPGP